MNDSAEAIGRVVADIRQGRVKSFLRHAKLVEACTLTAQVGVVVDATAIYHSLLRKEEPVDLYADHCIAPPWEEALVCYQNEHGNVIVMTLFARDYEADKDMGWDNEAEPIDWARCRWRIDSFIWCGGRSSTTGPMATMGPLMWWNFAVDHQGVPLDLHWVDIVPEYPRENWDMANLVLLGSLNFMNCRNVELVEPHRPRAEAKRVARTGVRVTEINVFPLGSRRAKTGTDDGAGTPLTSVRGHFARYGVEGRGLLFGKLAGRFWIPQHARGSAEVGTVEHSYTLRAE